MKNKKILAVYGTRPEEIKLYPFTKYNIEFLLVDQSKDLHQGLIKPDYKCSEKRLEKTIKRIKPDMVMVQGDTRTVFRAAVAAFENKIPIIHIEAGLRTFDFSQPFPEEGYRAMIDVIASHRYCSRPEAAKNCEGKYVGQTSIDTLFEFCGDVTEGDYTIVTVHRNESWDKLPHIIEKIKKIENKVVFAHPNRVGQELKKHFKCKKPLNYKDFVKLLAGCKDIMTDSGGLQEEAIALGKECIVLRDKSERHHDDIYEQGATKRIMEDLLKA